MPTAHPTATPGTRLRRFGLATAAALLSLNIWTGCPLAAVWVGSKVAGDSQLSMGAVVAVVLVLAVLVAVLVALLARVSEAYEHLSGEAHGARRTSPWLRSMRGEREDLADRRRNLGAIERILVGAVVLGAAAFEAWFFFFSGSPIGH
jgi:hypothetical protein